MIKTKASYLVWSLLIVAGLLLAACVPVAAPQAVPAPGEQETSAETEAESPAESAEKISLVFSDWHLTEKHWEATLLEAFEAYRQANPNVDVQLEYVSYGDKDTKYATEIEAGTGPDVIHLHAYSLRSFIERGYLLDLNPFIQQEGEDFLQAWYPQTLELMKKDETYYAIPGDFMSMGLFYNSKLFEEAGLDPDQPPKTWTEFLEYAQALTRDRNGDGQIDTWGFGAIGAIDPGFELRFSPVLYGHGADYLNADSTCSALNTPEAKQAFSFFVSLFTEHGVIPPGVTDQTAGTVRQQMANEQVAMKMGSGWTVPIVSSLNPDLNAAEILRVADIPVAEGANPEYITSAWLSAWAINKNSKHPEAAWDIIKFVTAKEQEQQWFDDAGVTSARLDVSTEYEPLVNDRFAQAIAGQLNDAKFVPQLKEWPQLIEAVNTATQEAFTGAKSPDEALQDAHNRINEILSVYRTGGETCPEF